VYYEFYGFAEPPFNITPDPRYLFFSTQHREALNHLLYGIRERKGFIQLTGEVGAGKTTTCRALFNELDHDRYVTALILNPMLSEAQMLRAILRELGMRKIARERLKNYDILNDYLLRTVKKGKDIVLVIDEAQDMKPEQLEQVRLLSNLETDNQKLIQIVLMGQPELRDNLDRPELRQLRQRITVRYHLGPLNEEETRRYIEHRISVAGSRGMPQFESRAVRRIYRYSKGIPRLINGVADKALLAGFINRADCITAKLVRIAERELEG